MSELPNIIYLHGLGSSPQSVKARLVSEFLAGQGFAVSVPSLAIPSLERLSAEAVVSYVTGVVERSSGEAGVVLIGSSFGGFVALHAYGRLAPEARARVRGLVLLAPVFYPRHSRHGLIAPDVEASWRERGFMPITDSATGQLVPLHYEFARELSGFNSDEVDVRVPALVAHGTKDETVSHEQSVEFCSKQSSAELVLFEDDHQLVADPDGLLSTIRGFISRMAEKHSTPGR